jgi:hypothetical protein
MARTQELMNRIAEVEDEKRTILEGQWGMYRHGIHEDGIAYWCGAGVWPALTWTAWTSENSTGSHPEWMRKKEALERIRERRIYAADQFKQHQIDNIGQLYEYEVMEADATYKVSVVHLGAKYPRWRSIARSRQSLCFTGRQSGVDVWDRAW